MTRCLAIVFLLFTSLSFAFDQDFEDFEEDSMREFAMQFRCCALPRKAYSQAEDEEDRVPVGRKERANCIYGKAQLRQEAARLALAACRQQTKMPCAVRFCRRFWK